MTEEKRPTVEWGNVIVTIAFLLSVILVGFVLLQALARLDLRWTCRNRIADLEVRLAQTEAQLMSSQRTCLRLMELVRQVKNQDK